MISRAAWRLRTAAKQVWVRVVGFAFLAIVSIGLARVLSPLLPRSIAMQTGSEAATQLLTILTASMLTVTTFSISIAVSAFAAAAGSATPRATVLLQEDRTTQNVLATFLGAFVFGLVGLVALHARLYDPSGQVVVFIFTIVVIGLVVVALIRWIDHLMQFGRMSDTLDRVERAASLALSRRLDNPYLGGRLLAGAPPAEARRVASSESGHVQHVDMQALQDCAAELGGRVFLLRLPGSFVATGEPLLSVEPASLDEDQAAALRRAFTVGSRRTFDEDPRFGLVVLAEIASRALSPAVNDPGTAIDILGRMMRILAQWRDRTEADVIFDRVLVAPITPRDAVEDAFRPIARDAASLAEVQIRLQKVLGALGRLAPEIFGEPAEQMAREALERSQAASLLPADLARIASAASLAPTTARDAHGSGDASQGRPGGTTRDV